MAGYAQFPLLIFVLRSDADPTEHTCLRYTGVGRTTSGTESTDCALKDYFSGSAGAVSE